MADSPLSACLPPTQKHLQTSNTTAPPSPPPTPPQPTPPCSSPPILHRSHSLSPPGKRAAVRQAAAARSGAFCRELLDALQGLKASETSNTSQTAATDCSDILAVKPALPEVVSASARSAAQLDGLSPEQLLPSFILELGGGGKGRGWVYIVAVHKGQEGRAGGRVACGWPAAAAQLLGAAAAAAAAAAPWQGGSGPAGCGVGGGGGGSGGRGSAADGRAAGVLLLFQSEFEAVRRSGGAQGVQDWLVGKLMSVISS